MRGCRIVIPQSLQQEILTKIHMAHQGITKCRDRARLSVWWPGLSTQLEELVKNCEICCKEQHQRAEPLIPSELPELPWQKVGTDLFEWKNDNYLLIVDYYSRFIEVVKLNRTTATEVINRTKTIFTRHGIPEVVFSDNGPQYSAEEYEKFSQDYQFEHKTSSPYFPQANGEAETAVRTVKELLEKNKDPHLALLNYHATPIQGGRYSPSELLMSRTLRTTIPTTRTQRVPRVPDREEVRTRDQRMKQRQKKNFDSHHGARTLPVLKTGDRVWIPTRQKEGTVQSGVAPRSLLVSTEDGSELRRNRKDIIELPQPNAGEQETQTEREQERSPTSKPQTPPRLRRSNRTPAPRQHFAPLIKH